MSLSRLRCHSNAAQDRSPFQFRGPRDSRQENAGEKVGEEGKKIIQVLVRVRADSGQEGILERQLQTKEKIEVPSDSRVP